LLLVAVVQVQLRSLLLLLLLLLLLTLQLSSAEMHQQLLPVYSRLLLAPLASAVLQHVQVAAKQAAHKSWLQAYHPQLLLLLLKQQQLLQQQWSATASALILQWLPNAAHAC
jgi:hypothetical protein